MATSGPDSAEVRAELAKILASDCFEQARRHRQFLRYVVEETLDGRADRLKGFSIAVSIFERSEDFDAQNDPLVRVEAGRLRQRLAQYYVEEGAADSVRISIPRGGYQAVFEHAETPA
jgi:hypothetical protein